MSTVVWHVSGLEKDFGVIWLDGSLDGWRSQGWALLGAIGSSAWSEIYTHLQLLSLIADVKTDIASSALVQG